MEQLSLFTSSTSPISEQETKFQIKKPAQAAWKLYVDGAARNNPGPAGIGIYLEKDGASFLKEGFFIGSKTNNQAEYIALLVGLVVLQHYRQPDEPCMIFSDSKLMVQQILGNYRVKQPELQRLKTHVMGLLSGIPYTIHHVPREKNQVADELANQGIDKKTKLAEPLASSIEKLLMV